jgi:hypothetical protein
MTAAWLLLLLQSGSLDSDADVREKFQPYRQCLVEQGRPLAGGSRTDEEIIGQARARCLASNLGSGSDALFALMKKGATKAQAIERGGRLREEAEKEAVAILRGSAEEPRERVALPSMKVFRKGPLDIEVPNAISDLHNKYALCQDRHFDVRRVRDPSGLRKETERAISACAAEKAALKKEAESRLAKSPGYATAARREAAIDEAFDGYDRVRRAMAEGRLR